MDDPRPSVAVLTLYTPEIRELGEFTRPSKDAYCRRHGYRFVCETRSLDPSRPPAWSKVKLLLRELPRHDLCLWIDADAMILNPDAPFEEILAEHHADADADLVIASDHVGINAGVFAMRRTAAAVAFLEAVYARAEFTHHPWWEQAAMMALLREGWPLRVAHLPKRAVNAYQNDYRGGDFILHTPGTADRLAVLRRFADAAHAVETALFAARGDAGHGRLALNALGYDSTTAGRIVHPTLTAGWEVLSAHADSQVRLTLHAPAEVVGFLNASASYRPDAPVEFHADRNALGRVAGPCGATAPVRLAAGKHLLEATCAGRDTAWRHSCWALRPAEVVTGPSPVRDSPARLATPDRLAVVTVACYDEREVPGRLRVLTESARRQGVWLTVWGVAERHAHHSDSKVLRLRRWLRSLPPACSHVLALDARDTVLQGDAAAMCDAYNAAGAPILVSAERLSAPVCDREWQARWPAAIGDRRFLNSGCFMAERGALAHALDVLAALWEDAVGIGTGEALRRLAPRLDRAALAFVKRWSHGNVYNDQYLWQSAVMTGAIAVKLDAECRLAATLSTSFTPSADNPEWEVRDGKLRARGSAHAPPVIHVPGIAPVEVLHAWAGYLGLLDGGAGT